MSARPARPDLIIRVAVASPVRRVFDYLPPPGDPLPAPGTRVRIPFGRARRVGMVLGSAGESELAPGRLRRIDSVLDPEPLLSPELLGLLTWSAAYFHHPIGDVVLGTLPKALREGRAASAKTAPRWRLTPLGVAACADDLTRAPRQRALFERFVARGQPLGAEVLGVGGGEWRRPLAALVERGWVEPAPDDTPPDPEPLVQGASAAGPPLNESQSKAVARVDADPDRFAAYLLDGVTGSGKTEVYIELALRTIARGGQVLVLIPEIGLTPQIVARFRAAIGAPVAVSHSGLGDRERLEAWLAARDGRVSVVLGTRSAVFSPLPRLGLVVVDEEHDASLKQHEGFRYSARDLAVMRARRCGVPVVLGSATPSLETLNNVALGRYTELRLPRRAGGAAVPRKRLVDVRGGTLDDGLSAPLVGAIADTLARGEQVLLFQNRRGFAPVIICRDCGWLSDCGRCDAHMVYHRDHGRLRCHHCGADRPMVEACPECAGESLRPLGLGTQRIEEALERRFPDARVTRVDRDSTRGRGSLEKVLEAVHAGETDILIGTQMLAKGHHFPNVTLVGILDADGGLFAADFRAGERMAQLLVQVSGRAGRGERPGEVLVQTSHPDHPLLAVLLESGYRDFCALALEERRQAGLPPFTAMALLRAEAAQREPGHDFLAGAKTAGDALAGGAVRLLGPVPAPLERRAGRYRWHLLLEANERAPLHRLLDAWLPAIEALPTARRVRWALDVDPQDLA